MLMPKHIYLKMSQQGYSAAKIKEFALYIKSVYTVDSEKEWEMLARLYHKYAEEANELAEQRRFESNTPDAWKGQLDVVVKGMYDVCG